MKMSNIKKILALVLALVMVFALCACGESNTPAPEESKAPVEESKAPVEENTSTLVYATSTFGQKFSPFFYTTAYDEEVVSSFTGGLLAADRGGAIIPGIKLSYGALSSGTSLLPDIAILPPKKVIATNTVDSMRSGAVYGTAAMLDGMIDRMEKEIGYPCTVVATGGLARTVVQNCSHDIVYDADLLLKGLWVLYDRNRKS